jgi:hypothetical protein
LVSASFYKNTKTTPIKIEVVQSFFSNKRFIRNKPNPNYFFLEAIGEAFLAGAFTGAFFALGLLFDLAVTIIIRFKN